MKNYIFYFTGTGNSLDISNKLKASLGNTQLINIAEYQDSDFKVEDSDTIGFVFPVYVFRHPILFDAFISKLKINNYKYMFAIALHGGSPFGATRIFENRLVNQGFNLNASFNLISPDNYLESSITPDKQESKNILVDTYHELNNIINCIKEKEMIKPKIKIHQLLMGSILAKTFPAFAKKAPSKFYYTSKCNNCGLCQQICPKKIISLDNNNVPIWEGSNCEMCFACINLCPQKAIEYSKNTISKNRYINPYVTLKELMNK